MSADEVGALTRSRVVRGERCDTTQIKVPKPVMFSLMLYKIGRGRLRKSSPKCSTSSCDCDGWWPRGQSAVEQHLRREREREIDSFNGMDGAAHCARGGGSAFTPSPEQSKAKR